MVKKRNHYIPRVLLRRFAFRETAKGQAYLWQMPRGAKPISLETKNAGVESFFYGDPSNGVEDGLADIETEWRELLDRLDRGHDIDQLHSELWRFAWVLGVRTRSVREHWTNTVQAMVTAMAATEDGTIGAAALRLFEGAVEKHWQDALAALPTETRAAILEAIEIDPTIKTRLLDHARHQVTTALPGRLRALLGFVTAASVMGGTVEGQIKGLSGILSADMSSLNKLAPESWTVIAFPPQSVVLGDGVTFTVGPNGQVGTVARFKDDLEAIYVPISHERVLVGHRRNSALFSLDAINRASAGLSSSFIFAARNSEIEQALALQIGRIEPMLSGAEQAEVLDDVWHNMGASD